MVFINYSEFSKLKNWFRTHAFPVLIIPMLRSLSHVYISFMLCTTTPHFTLYLARPSLFSCLVSSLLACVLNWGPIYPEKRPITTAHFCVHVMLAQHHKTTFFFVMNASGFIQCIKNPKTAQIHHRPNINVSDGDIIIRGTHKGWLGKLLFVSTKCYSFVLVN